MAKPLYDSPKHTSNTTMNLFANRGVVGGHDDNDVSQQEPTMASKQHGDSNNRRRRLRRSRRDLNNNNSQDKENVPNQSSSESKDIIYSQRTNKLQTLTSSLIRRRRVKNRNNENESIGNTDGNTTPSNLTMEEASKLRFSHLSEVCLFHSTSKRLNSPTDEAFNASGLSTRSDSWSSSYDYPQSPCSNLNLISPSSVNRAPRRSPSMEFRWLSLVDDPTVEESFECVFSHQLEQGDLYIDNLGGGYDDGNRRQSINNNNNNGSNENDIDYEYQSGKIVQIGQVKPYLEFQRNQQYNSPQMNTVKRTLSNSFKFIKSSSLLRRNSEKFCHNNTGNSLCEACKNGTNDKPMMPPYQWPQCPLLLRPTPGSGTRVRGVRFANTINNDEYLMDSSIQNNWWDELEKFWGMNHDDDDKKTKTKLNHTMLDGLFCSECCILPLNNGNEENGQTLAVDFESDLFEGTLQIRIRRSNGTTMQPYDDSFGFFNGKNRQYQCIISGRFKKDGIPMTECITGQMFSRPLKTPAPYITKGAIKLVSFFAPRLQAKLSGEKPYVISPLGSTPQSIQVDDCAASMMNFSASETIVREPIEPLTNCRRIIALPNKTSSMSASIARAKARKKAFDKLCGSDDKNVTFRTDKIYTFEFLQHLVNFDTMEMNLGGILGSYKLNNMLNGQPLNIMAARQYSTVGDDKKVFEKMWSFDLWHESILA